MVFFLLPFTQAQEGEFGPCPKGKAYKDLCLFASSTKGRGDEKLCQKDGGTPFLPLNAQENKAAGAAYVEGTTTSWMWIAGTDVANPGTWLSEDPRRSGKITYTNWVPNQPNDVDGKQRCLEIGFGHATMGKKPVDGGWNDETCSGGNTGAANRICAMPRPKLTGHERVMTNVDVVKNLIDAVAASHSDMDASVKKVHAHVKSFKSVKNRAISDLQKIRGQLDVMKTTLAEKSAKLKAEDKKITGALAQLKAKWMKLNAQQSKKLDEAEERRAAENAKISKMITHLSRRRRRSME